MSACGMACACNLSYPTDEEAPSVELTQRNEQDAVQPIINIPDINVEPFDKPPYGPLKKLTPPGMERDDQSKLCIMFSSADEHVRFRVCLDFAAERLLFSPFTDVGVTDTGSAASARLKSMTLTVRLLMASTLNSSFTPAAIRRTPYLLVCPSDAKARRRRRFMYVRPLIESCARKKTPSPAMRPATPGRNLIMGVASRPWQEHSGTKYARAIIRNGASDLRVVLLLRFPLRLTSHQ